MGDWNITIRGTGAHHNEAYPLDANRMAGRFVEALTAAGHQVRAASFTHGGEDALAGGYAPAAPGGVFPDGLPPQPSPGARAFVAYNAAKGGLTHDGKPIPPWGEVGDAVRAAWEAAASAVLGS